METIPTLEIQPATRTKTIMRIPEIMEGLADGRSIQDIAKDLGISRVAVWKNLRRVDFEPVVSLAVTKALENIELIGDAKDRAWLFIQLGKLLHSKKVKIEGKYTTHTINEERRTARLELDLLSPDEQRTLIELQAKMRTPIDVDAEIIQDTT